MVVIVYADNAANSAVSCIESIRNFGGDNPISVVLVDNASTDGLREWGEQQTDITYVYMDEGHQNYGKVLNEVIEGLNISDDIFFMEARALVTPGMIDAMNNALNIKTDAGILIPQYVYKNAEPSISYEDTVVSVMNHNQTGKFNQVLSAMFTGYVVRPEIYQTYKFNEDIFNPFICVMDYSLSVLLEKKMIYEVADAYLYEGEGENYRYMVAGDRVIMESKWKTHYFNVASNENIVNAVCKLEKENLAILEIGCDIGSTLLDIKNRIPGARIYGTDLNENSIRIAKCVLDNAVVNNIEEYNLDLGDVKFDVIIFGDVLEHLRNPLGAIEYCKSLLAEGGHLVASIPNLMNITVLEQLINGDFPYREEGLLDKTHIHFFTFNEIVRMFVHQAGYTIEDVQSVKNPLTEEQIGLIDKLMALSDKTQEWMYRTFQYLVVASLKKS